MTTITFDTLNMARRLRDEAHFTPEQAEGTARVLAESMSEVSGLAVTGDIHRLEAKIDRLESRIEQSELRMTIRLGGMMVVAVSAAAALVKLL